MTQEIKKGLLIFPIIKDLNKADGILVKNEGIWKGFIQNGIDTDVLEFNSSGVFNEKEKLFTFHPNRYKRIYQYNVQVWKAIGAYARTKNYDFIWFRIPVVTPPIAGFVKKLKKDNPRCKVIIEYGAYPYVNELTGLVKIVYQLNRRNEKIVHANANFVITYSGQKTVDNVPNIPINNGIDLSGITTVNHSSGISNQINFISVSSLKKWHAYERFIAGLPAYFQDPHATPIHFNIVGNGPEYEKLVNLTTTLKLNEHVTFHHFKTGEELNTIYLNNHVAIGTLGFHRIGLTNSSSLKNREYFAKGLPIVLSTTDLDMPPGLPYVEYVPEGEEPLNIKNIVDFARKIYSSPTINAEIRKYAEENVSWKSKISMVLEHLRY